MYLFIFEYESILIGIIAESLEEAFKMKVLDFQSLQDLGWTKEHVSDQICVSDYEPKGLVFKH